MEQHHRRQKHLTEALPKSSSSPSMAHRAPSTRTPHTSGSQPPGAARDAAAADSAPHTANSAPGLSDPRARNSSSGSSSSHLSPTVHPPSLVNGRISSPLSASQRRRPPLADAGGRALGASPSPSPSPSLSTSSSVSAAAATAAAPSAAQPMDIPKPPRSQRIVGTDEINKALEASVDDDDDEDDDDDKNNNNMGSVRPESILHGTPPRSARIKHNIFGDGDSP
ncbi:hypothetical protein GGI11_007077 [Coemansia sp. RSA 2049]|nr:hypothetical protein GGI11_007077 [Coemansia sp. RSA 2049]